MVSSRAAILNYYVTAIHKLNTLLELLFSVIIIQRSLQYVLLPQQ